MSQSIGTRAFGIDAAAIAAVSTAICLFQGDLVRMSIVVAVVLATRMSLWMSLPEAERGGSRRAELLFYGLCTVLGAFNDWNSVTRHGIYEYRVATDLPGLSDIPAWMLLYWGMILRYVVSLVEWLGLQPGDAVLGRRHPTLRLALLLGLVLFTRLAIYRLYLDPLWSWAPFALALIVAFVACRPSAPWLLLMGGVLVVGPAFEVLYIEIGGLHVYHLGWLYGVPLWIALWWVLAVLVWGEIAPRIQRVLSRR